MNKPSIIFTIFLLIFMFPSISAAGSLEENASPESSILSKLNFYLDSGYCFSDYCLNYKHNWRDLTWNEVEITGKDYFDITAGARFFFNIFSVPLYADASISDLFEVVRNRGVSSNTGAMLPACIEDNTWQPFYNFRFGSYKELRNYMFSGGYFYSKNLKGNNKSMNKGFSISLSRLFKIINVGGACGFMKRDLNLNGYDFKEKVTFVELSLSYQYGYLSPYIAYYKELHNNLKRFDSDSKGGIFRVGMNILNSKIKRNIKNIMYNFPFDYVVHRYFVWKPNIYLYPEKDQKIRIKLDGNNDSYITESIPDYGEGWDVFVEKGGRIDGKYDYLFYEGDISEPKSIKTGWCVKKVEIMVLFDSILKEYCFNDKEILDFIDCWSVHIPDGKYYKIHPIVDSEVDSYFELDISPRPESVRRVWFYVIPANTHEKLSPPDIKPFIRNGFTVTEWGVIVR